MKGRTVLWIPIFTILSLSMLLSTGVAQEYPRGPEIHFRHHPRRDLVTVYGFTNRPGTIEVTIDGQPQSSFRVGGGSFSYSYSLEGTGRRAHVTATYISPRGRTFTFQETIYREGRGDRYREGEWRGRGEHGWRNPDHEWRQGPRESWRRW